MNKNDLIEALAPRLGDRAVAASAVESLVDLVLREVAAGGTVGITGFGTFEPVDRAPRTGRNPHTGEAVPIAATRTPRFRPGSYFKGVVADPGLLPTSGLAGARVGSAEDEAAGTPAGVPPTIRRSAAAKKDAGGRSRGRAAGAQPADTTETATARRARTGAPDTVRAERPQREQAPAAEPRRERASGRRMSIGGEQITREMITAKKAQLARAKDDDVTEGADRPARSGQRGKDKKAADQGSGDPKLKKDKKKGKKDKKKGKKDKKA